MDHELARINVHWLNALTEGEQYSFHVEKLSKHLLDDANSLRAAIRTIKNIFNYGADTRLRTFCKALDAYRETVILKKEAVTTQKNQEYEIRTKPQSERRRRNGRAQLPSYEQQEY
jgi:elongation factor P hydroxylase